MNFNPSDDGNPFEALGFLFLFITACVLFVRVIMFIWEVTG